MDYSNIFNWISENEMIITIFITVFSTVVSGTLVFTIGQIVLKFFIEPIHKQKEVIGEIADVLCYYREFCTNSKKENEPMKISKERENAVKKLKKLRSQLIARTYFIPYYKIFAIFGLVVKKQNIKKAEIELTILININSSNTEGIFKKTGLQAVGKLFKLFDMDIYEKDVKDQSVEWIKEN